MIAANVAPRTASAYYNDRNAFKNEKKMKSRGNITRTVKGLQRLKDRNVALDLTEAARSAVVIRSPYSCSRRDSCPSAHPQMCQEAAVNETSHHQTGAVAAETRHGLVAHRSLWGLPLREGNRHGRILEPSSNDA